LFNWPINILIPEHCTAAVDSELDRDFSLTDLETCIHRLSSRKAPGPDGIPNEVWECLSYENNCILLECFNKCWNERTFPDEWSHITIAPIFKKGDKSIPDNYRPICLVNTVFKLYTSMLSDRLSQWCERNRKVSCSQPAYRKGYGCEDHVFVLNSILQLNCSKRRKQYALFIDLSKAFDLVHHDLSWSKLYNVGLSKKFVKICNIYIVVQRRKSKQNLVKVILLISIMVFFKESLLVLNYLLCS
jgi:hypothetical protein